MNYYVYHLINPKDGSPFYVGKGILNRMYIHEIDTLNGNVPHNNKLLYNKIKKVLKESGKINYKIISENLTEKESFSLEIDEIKKYGRKYNKTGILCNLTDGGEGMSGLIHTKETKRKLSIKARKPEKIKISIENFKRATEKNRGKRKLKECHNKIVELYEQKSITEIQKILGCDFGTLKTYLVENNLFVPNKNRHLTEKTKFKMKTSNKGKRSVPVRQYDLNGKFLAEFDSIKSACRKVGKSDGQIGSICNCCRGGQPTAYGYIWKYKVYE